MTNETKHTATPWVAVRGSAYWEIHPKYRKHTDPFEIGNVCASYPSNKDQGLQQANAAHIVKCVNAHDDLVSVLKHITAAYDDLLRNSPCDIHVDLVSQARAALKKASE